MNSLKYLAMLLSVIATGALVAGDSGSYEQQRPAKSAYKTQPARSRHYARQQTQGTQQINGPTRNEALQQERTRRDTYVRRRDYDRNYDRRNDRRHLGDSRVWPWNWGRN